MSGSCGNPFQDAEALVPVPLNFAAADYRNGLPRRSSRFKSAFTQPASDISSFSRKRLKDGGADRDRTDDLKLAKLPLSQLSYGPV